MPRNYYVQYHEILFTVQLQTFQTVSNYLQI